MSVVKTTGTCYWESVLDVIGSAVFVLGDLKWIHEIGNSNGVDVGLMREKLFVVEKHFF